MHSAYIQRHNQELNEATVNPFHHVLDVFYSNGLEREYQMPNARPKIGGIPNLLTVHLPKLPQSHGDLRDDLCF